MKRSPHMAALAALLFSTICALASAREGAAEALGPGEIDLSVDGDQVRIETQEAPVSAIIAALSRKLDVEIRVGKLKDRPVTLRYEQIAVEDLLSRLGVNFTLVYTRERATGAVTLEGGWAASSPEGPGTRNSLVIPEALSELIEKVLGPYDEAIKDAFGVVYPVVYPVTVSIDGQFTDWPSNLPWNVISASVGSFVPLDEQQRNPAHHPAAPPVDNADGAYAFSAVADQENLYVAVQVFDDRKVTDELADDQMLWADDSIEFYVDGGNEKATAYDENDAQITIGRVGDGGDPMNPRMSPWKGYGQGVPGSQTGTRAAVFDNEYGWTVEAAIPLATFGIQLRDGMTIGWNVHINDDDDGGGRDHKLMWSLREQVEGEQSFYDPSAFGNIEFFDIHGGSAGDVSP